MDQEQYLKLFGLTPLEMQLKILNCSPDKISTSTNITSIEIETETLNRLPYQDQSFDIALCYQILFTSGTKGTNQDFHLKALIELARVASEVRIFPLVDNQGSPSNMLGPILQALQQKGFGVELKQTEQGQKPGAILRLWNESCMVEKN